MRPHKTLASALLFGAAFLMAASVASAALAETHSLRWYRRHHITPPWEMQHDAQPADDQASGDQAEPQTSEPVTIGTTGHTNGSTGTIISAHTVAMDSPGGTKAVAPLIGGMTVDINRCVQGWCLITRPVTGWVMEIEINK